MNTGPRSLSPEELLEHAPWVRALARALVHDPDQAEDISQQALLAALRKPPDARLSFRPWLRTVVRNLAFERGRTRARHAAREADKARDAEPTVDPAELVARVELQAMLQQHVTQLDEPLRSTILLRYFEELSAAEIARRTGVPEGTVRWRTKQAIDDLRTRLDRAHGGDRADWMHALTLLVANPDARGGTDIAKPLVGASAILVSTKFWVGVLVLATSAVVWYASRPSGSGTATVDVAVGPSAAISPRTSAASELLAPIAPPRSVVRSVKSSATWLASVLYSLVSTPTRVTARIVDDDDNPVGGALFRGSANGVSFSTHSDDAGFVELETSLITEVVQVRLRAEGPDFSCWDDLVEFDQGEDIDLGDLRLVPGARVHGVVLDPRGRPIENAMVRMRGPELRDDEIACVLDGPPVTGLDFTSTRSDGSFVFIGVGPGEHRVWAVAKDSGWAWTDPFVVEAGQSTSRLELRVPVRPDDPVLTVRVVDERDEPVKYAQVRAVGLSGETLARQTDTDGVLAMRGPPRLESARLVHAWSSTGEVEAHDIQSGPEPVVLRLEPSRTLALRVVGPSGEPIPNFYASTRRHDKSEESGDIARSSNPPHADGIVEVRRPRGVFDLRVVANGFCDVSLERLDVVTQPVVVHMTPKPKLAGRVTKSGVPAPLVLVQAHRALESREMVIVNGSPSLMHQTPGAGTRTDATGHFTLPIPPEGAWWIRCGEEKSLMTISGPVELRVGEFQDDFEIDIEPMGSIEGRVLAPQGRSTRGTIVRASRFDGSARTVRVDARSFFRIDGLPPGDWHLSRADRELPKPRPSSLLNFSFSWRTGRAPEAWQFPGDVRVRPGETTRFDLTLEAELKARIHGRVTIDGKPARHWKVEADAVFDDPFELREHRDGTCDAEGNYQVVVRGRDRATVTLTDPRSSNSEMSFRRSFELVLGEVASDLAFETGAIEGRIENEDWENLYCVWTDGRDWRSMQRIRPDAEGEFALALAPTGRCRIVQQGKSAWDDDPWTWDSILEFDVERGETARITLR